MDKTRNNSTPSGVAGSSGNSAGGDEAGAVSETMDSKQAPAAEESGLRQRNVVKWVKLLFCCLLVFSLALFLSGEIPLRLYFLRCSLAQFILINMDFASL